MKKLVGVLVAVVVLELVVRQVWVHQRIDVPGYVKIATPGTTSVYRLEGSGTSHRDADGFRLGYRQGGPKVLVLGDSFTEALEVNDDEVFTYLAQELAAKQGIDVSVVNHGVAGRSVADYVAFVRRHLELVKPAWTVVVIRDDDLAEDTIRPDKTRFELGKDGRLTTLVDEPRSAGRVRDWIWSNPSIFVRFTFYRLKNFILEHEKDPPLFLAASQESKKRVETNYQSYPIERALDQLKAAYGGRVSVLSLPYLDYGPPRVRMTEVRSRMRSHCIAIGLSCIEPEGEFMELARENLSPFGFPQTEFNFGHMNASGHEAVGRALARELVTLRLNALF